MLNEFDEYPTRKNGISGFIDRLDPVIRGAANGLHEYELLRYKKYGFLHLKSFFHASLIDQALATASSLDETTCSISREPGSDRIRSALRVHPIAPFDRLRHDGRLNAVIASIIGGDSYIHQSRINYKNGLSASGWDWHSDFETWHSQDGMPRMRALSAMIPLQRNTYENGALMVIPKSHRHFYSCEASQDTGLSAESEFSAQKEGIPTTEAIARYFEISGGVITTVLCEPGDLFLFDCNTIHVSGPNMTPHGRTNLFFVFNSIENQLAAPFSGSAARPEYMAERDIEAQNKILKTA